MAFPQPDSNEPASKGQKFFRLKAELVSPGDLYESEQGALGFALGPDSDLASILITYFDSQQAERVSQLTLSPDRSFVGLIPARNDTQYPDGRNGRTLISVNDIFDPRWRPSGFTPGDDSIEFVQPVLDVIQYFVEEPSLIPQRSDKIYRFQYFPLPGVAGGSTWIVVPTYGRKSGYITVVNRDPIATVTVNVFGAKLSTSGVDAGSGTVGSTELLLFGPSALLTGQSDFFEFLSSTMGLWDYFAIELDNYVGGTTGAMPITITLSDDAL